MRDSKLDFLKEKDIEKTIALIKERGKYNVLAEYATFFDMRTYFKVDEDGNINKKNYNPIILLYSFCNNEKLLAEYLFKYSFPKEKQNIKKISRASNLEIESLKKNLMKTLVNSNLDFSKTFAKELFLRNKKAFFEVLYNFSLMGDPKDLKLFFVHALEKIFTEIDYEENIFYLVIAYLTKCRDDFKIYLEAEKIEEINLDEIKSYSKEKVKYIEIFEEVLKKYDLKNSKKFRISLMEHFREDFSMNDDLKNILVEQ